MGNDYSAEFDAIISSKKGESDGEKFSKLRKEYIQGKYSKSTSKYMSAVQKAGYANERLKDAKRLEDIYSALSVYEDIGRYTPSVKAKIINKLKTLNKSAFEATGAKNRLTKIKRFLNEEKMSDLEHLADSGSKKVLSVIALAGGVLGLFFLSPNLTGNAVSSLNQTSSSWIGGVLLLIGLVAFYISKKK